MPRKKSLYNVILKEFTKINKKLPADRKVSIKDRRRIVKEQLVPQFQGTPTSRIRLRPLRAAINQAYEQIPPRELCDLNYIDVASQFAYVEWFSLDETITELVPDCVFVKVSGGDFGTTRIFNTRDYQYGREGVRGIVENIRPMAQNESGRYIFSGYQKLRPRKRNNGNPENYYLDFVLIEIDSQGRELPVAETESVRYEIPKDKETKKKKTKIKNLIEGKIKSLKQKREKKKRVKKTLDTKIKTFGQTIKKLNKRKNQDKARQDAREQFLKALELLEKYKKEGKLTDKQYKAAFDKIFKEFNQ